MNPNAVIVADRPLGTAIERVLRIFAVRSVCFPKQMIQDIAGSNSCWKWPLSAQSAKDALYDCKLVIAVDSERRGPVDIVALLHLLRGRWLGDARFIALIHSSEERKRLIEFDLFGDSGGAFAFGKIVGHSALDFPLKLVELLRECQLANLSTGRMTARSWKIEFADQACALKIVRNLKILRNLNRRGDTKLAVIQARELAENFYLVKWNGQFFPNDHHAGPELVRQFYNKFPHPCNLKTDDLLAICEITDQILNMSVFACLNLKTTNEKN